MDLEPEVADPRDGYRGVIRGHVESRDVGLPTDQGDQMLHFVSFELLECSRKDVLLVSPLANRAIIEFTPSTLNRY